MIYMKIEINLDEKFFEEKIKENRAASFSSSMEIWWCAKTTCFNLE